MAVVTVRGLDADAAIAALDLIAACTDAFNCDDLPPRAAGRAALLSVASWAATDLTLAAAANVLCSLTLTPQDLEMAAADCTSVAKVGVRRSLAKHLSELSSAVSRKLTTPSSCPSLQEHLQAFAHAVARTPSKGRLVQLLEVWQGVCRSERPSSSLLDLT